MVCLVKVCCAFKVL
uniref:Uncharacterized protein n=1 Tax=Arundo donax TaxID=35708 RepID=A0A0A9B2I2_ARUDO